MEFDYVPEEHEIPETRSSKAFDKQMRELIEQLKFPDQLPDEYNYKKPYLILFNGFTSAIQALNRMDFGRARQILMIAQQDAEDAYISAADESREEGQAQEEIQIDA